MLHYIAASINSLRFADIIKEVINIDIGSVPFFGSLPVLNIGFSISRGNMTTKLLNTALPSDSPLKRYIHVYQQSSRWIKTEEL